MCDSNRVAFVRSPPDTDCARTPKGVRIMAINPDEAKGRLKQAAGDITGNDDLKNEGKADEAEGKVKDAVKKVGEKAEEAVDKVRDAVKGD